MNPHNDWKPDGLVEVWRWKDACYHQVEKLPTDEAIRELLKRAHQEGEELRSGQVSFDRTLSTE